MSSVEESINSATSFMRKSVENTVVASHNVIGTSISQALAFTSAMTLPASSPQQAAGDVKPSHVPHPRSPGGDQRSVSPQPCGHDSPRLSPKAQRKYLSPNDSSNEPDQASDSVNNIKENGGKEKDSTSNTSKDGSKENVSKDSKEGPNIKRSKKKSSWYNVLYPTYKSRSEDFKRIFKDVPDDERLVVDYSCALQKEILVHGRLYVSQNYLCFYANIFRWETLVSLRWKDVTAITKEKTALVIPNAILVYTANEKLFFTSFGSRDKTYLMLFRVWQNTLMGKQMSQKEMWQWVHSCYGDELGLTSDDEDYISPEGDNLSIAGVKLSVDQIIAEDNPNIDLTGGLSDSMLKDKLEGEPMGRSVSPDPSTDRHLNISLSDALPTDLSDTSESDVDSGRLSNQSKEPPAQCTSLHDGRLVLKTIIPMHIDGVFTQLYTSSKFFLDFHKERRTTDLTQTMWTHDSETGLKTRTLTMTVALNQSVGPKSSNVTENQMMLPCSKPGQLYSIDVESSNANIPYADSFFVILHHCLQKVTDNETQYEIYAQIKYRKSVWGLIKGMIEKNCWAGLDEFYTALTKALLLECEPVFPSKVQGIVKRKSKRRRNAPTIDVAESFHQVRGGTIGPLMMSETRPSFSSTDYTTWIVLIVLVMLVFLNAMLYMKLWALEEGVPYSMVDLNVLKDPPKTHDEWLRLLQQQETLHSVEMKKWQQVLQVVIHKLKKAEDSLLELQQSIHPSTSSKVMSALNDVINNKGDSSTKTEL